MYSVVEAPLLITDRASEKVFWFELSLHCNLFNVLPVKIVLCKTRASAVFELREEWQLPSVF